MSGVTWKDVCLAACKGDLELVRYHVRMGVDVNNAHPEFISTALVASILAGEQDVAQYLVDNGADLELLSNFDGLTPTRASAQMRMTLRHG